MTLSIWKKAIRSSARASRRVRRPVAPSPLVIPRLEPLETRVAPVVGAFGRATPVLPGTGFDGVVAVTDPNGSLCTGTLLSTGRNILTAGHCVTDDMGMITPGNFTVTFDLPGPQAVQMTVPSANVTTAPGWTGDVHKGNDLAILQLPGPAPAGVASYQLYDPAAAGTEVGQNFTVIGYGLTGWGAVGDTCGALCDSGAKRTGQNTFDALADVLANAPLNRNPNPPNGTALACDFDDGMAAHDAMGTYYGIGGLGLGNAEAFPSQGDSGGPGLINGRVAGVVSYRDVGNGPPVDVLPGFNSSFGEIGVYTRVSAFAGWINQVVSANQFQVTINPPNPVAGAAVMVTVTAVNSSGHVIPGYRGTVTFTSTDGGATLPPNYTFVAGDNGQHVFAGVMLTTSGPQTITVTDTVSPPRMTGSGSATVRPAATSGFLVALLDANAQILPPGPVGTGVPLGVLVAATDMFGNLTPTYQGTVNFRSNDAMATLPPNYTFMPADAGVHAFRVPNGVTFQTAGMRTVTVTDVAAAAVNGTSRPVQVVAPGTAVRLGVFAGPTVVAGVATTVTVIAFDVFGNVATGYTGTVHFTSNDPAAAGVVLPGDYAFVAADNGVHVFAAGVTLATAGNRTVTARDTVTATITGSTSITVTPAATARLRVVPASPNVLPNVAFGVTVTAQDMFGNTTPAYRGTIHFTSNDPAGAGVVLPADYAFVAADNGVHNFPGGVTLVTAGARTITATDTAAGAITGVGNVTVGPAVAARIRVVPSANPVMAGAAFMLTVTIQDALGNTVTGYTGTVQFTSTDMNAGRMLPANYTFTTGGGMDNGMHMFPGVVLATVGSQTITVTDTVAAAVTGMTVPIVVNPAATARLQVVPTANLVVAGTPVVLTVTAQDRFGNTTPAYTGTISFASNDPAARLPGNYTFVAGDRGVHVFFGANAPVLNTAGARTITATDTAAGAINGTANVMVVAGAAAASLQVTVSTNPVNAGVAFSVTVTALDARGFPTPNYTGTITFTSTDRNGAVRLPANYAFVAADAGTHVFNGVILATAGNQMITATDTAAGAINGMVAVTVNAAPTARLRLVPSANPVVAGAAFMVTVTAQDQFGNTTTGYLGTIHFTSTDANAAVRLPADYTFVAADNGVHVFNGVILATAGNQTITATDTIAGALTGNVVVMVNPAATARLRVSPSLPATVAGVGISITVTAQDMFGNTTPAYTGTVRFTSTDGAAMLPANYTFVAGDNGIHTFNGVVLKTAGLQTVTVTDTAAAAITGNAQVLVIPAAVFRFLLRAAINPVTAGLPFTLTVTALDAYGNTVIGYLGTIGFTSSDPGAMLPPAYTFSAGDNGVHTFANGVTLNTTGDQTITATDTSDSTVYGSTTVTVNQGTTGTMTMLSSYPNPSYLTQQVTFSASVTAATGTPTGTVTFMDGTTALGSPVTLDAYGYASFVYANLPLGNHTVTAVYTPDTMTYMTSTSPPVTQMVVQAGTTTALSTYPNPSYLGQAVTFSASVSAPYLTPTGTVTFLDGTTALGNPVTLDAFGYASFVYANLPLGNHTITAVYTPDTMTYTTSTSSPVTQMVIQAGTTTALSTYPNPSYLGQAVTFSASVSAPYLTPTGTVTFLDGTTALGNPVPLDAFGYASLVYPGLGLGNHSVTAVYTPDTMTYTPSTSPPVTQMVVQAGTTTALSTYPNPSSLGQAVTFSASVSAPYLTPTGTVTFLDGSTALGNPVTLDAYGYASLVYADLPVGDHTITAVYTPDTMTYTTSTSPPLTQTVESSPGRTNGKGVVLPSSELVSRPVTTLDRFDGKSILTAIGVGRQDSSGKLNLVGSGTVGSVSFTEIQWRRILSGEARRGSEPASWTWTALGHRRTDFQVVDAYFADPARIGESPPLMGWE